ncbi:1-deoxy-D-xylulose-5-phosphate synthase [uncultured Clostridium sp.]|nr:1-deoxy-D-xylulose-5-phosphate synthase [uncultured Clostridium sp.]
MYKSLDDIHSPQDIKDMNIPELEQLAGEIRQFLVQSISQTGGHLASNLGVVELTLAIHKIFNSPQDKIIWDVGHQAYVHKLLTGRKAQFASLRQMDGLSGFPKRAESCHDAFDTGHSSTSVSAALGIARARDQRGDNFSVVSVIGDGALSGGMAFEALNDAGQCPSKIIVILNDNDMSISHSVGAVSMHLSKIRSGRTYTGVKRWTEDFVERIPVIGPPTKRFVEKIKNSLKYLVVPGVLFEELGFKYLGPVDGHDIGQLEQMLTSAQEYDRPVFVHVVTRKGKGYERAEIFPERYHGVAPFFIDTGMKEKDQSITFSATFGQHLTKMAMHNEKIIAISAAMVEGTGLTPFRQMFPQRLFDVGIAEQHGVTLAAGLATQGLRPFFAVYSTFAQRAFDQILHDVCLQNLPVVFALDRAGLTGEDGETHQGLFDLSMLLPLPNMTILSPANADELRKMMEFALTMDGPCAIRYSKAVSRLPNDDTLPPIQLGKWTRLREGDDGVLIASGNMVEEALDIRERLLKRGKTISVVNARFIKPLDEEMLSQMAHTFPLIATLEDNVLIGGFGAVVGQFLLHKGTGARFLNLGYPDKFIEHGARTALMARYGMDAASLAEKLAVALEEIDGEQ